MSRRRIITSREMAIMAEPFLREGAEDAYSYMRDHPGLADNPMTEVDPTGGPTELHSEETYRHLKRVRNNPNLKVPIYRPVPVDPQGWQGYPLATGDTVTTSYDHAAHQARNAFGDDGWTITHTWVPANQLGASSHSVNEWRYSGGPQSLREHPKAEADRKHRERVNQALQTVIARRK